jgi:hypothetical protein
MQLARQFKLQRLDRTLFNGYAVNYFFFEFPLINGF